MATIPQELQDAFQAAFDAASLSASLQQQQQTLQSQLTDVNAQLVAAFADRDVKEQAVVDLTRQLLGPGALPPDAPPNG